MIEFHGCLFSHFEIQVISSINELSSYTMSYLTTKPSKLPIIDT